MKKNFSINEDKIKVNFMISKEINQKIKEKRFKEKTTIKNIVEKILQDNFKKITSRRTTHNSFK